MNAQQGRIFEALVETRRLEDESFHLGAVGARELRVLYFRELQLIEPGPIGEGQLPPLVPGAVKHLGGQMRFADEARDLPVVALRPAAQAQRALDEPAETLARSIDARQVSLAAVFEHESHFAAVGRKAGRRHVAVQAFGEHPRRASRCGRYRQVVDGVPDDLGFDDAGVGDEIAVGTPGGRTVGARIVGNPQQRRAGIGIVRGYDPDIGVVAGVGFLGAIADEGDQAAVRAPGRIRVIIVAGCDLHRLRLPAGVDVLHVQVRPAAIQVSDVIALDLQAVDHPGFFFVLVALGLLFGIADHEHQPFAVGRPGVIGHSLFDMGKLIRFAAAPVQGPDLGLAVVARREKGQVAAVGTPLRTARRGSGPGHGQDGIVGGGSHPDTRLGVVLFEAGRAYRIGDPAAIGADHRAAHGFQFKQVFRLEQAGLLGGGARRRQRQYTASSPGINLVIFLTLSFNSASDRQPGRRGNRCASCRSARRCIAVRYACSSSGRIGREREGERWPALRRWTCRGR